MTRQIPVTRTRAAVQALALALPLVSCACSRPSTPPNVILVSVDTLRADRLNAYGFEARQVSPHIDALAQDGILFENCITASPWTTPAHMSLLTSLNPGAHGITASFRDLRKDVESGRHFVTLSRSIVTLAEVLAAEDIRTAAFTAGGTVDPKIGFGRGFESYDTSMLKLGAHNTPAVAQWLRRNTDEPFFLFLHTFEVHAPYVRTRFLHEVLPPGRAAPLKHAIDTLGRTMTAQDPAGEEFRTARRKLVDILRDHQAYDAEVSEALYLAGIHHTDQWIGSVVAELKRLQIYDSTLIVLTSDHGEEFGDHDPTEFYDRHGHTLYEELIRVPLIIKLPRQRHGGSRVTRLTRIIDVMPTVLDVVGVEGHPPRMQGVSLRSLWGEGDASFPGAAVSEALATRAEKKSIRTDRHKLVISIAPKRVKDHGRGSIPAQVEAVQLFDLELDPRETENLLIDPILPQTLELAADLEARLRQAVAPHRAKPEKTILDLETVERLRGLGYLEE